MQSSQILMHFVVQIACFSAICPFLEAIFFSGERLGVLMSQLSLPEKKPSDLKLIIVL